MEGKANQVSRREKRKGARQVKKQQKYQSWVQHRQLQKTKKSEQIRSKFETEKPKDVKESKNSLPQSLEEREDRQHDPNAERKSSSEKENVLMESEVKSGSSGKRLSAVARTVKQKKGLKRNSRTKFEEYLEMNMEDTDKLAKEDLEMERRLAKKLKVKDGKLRGMDDELNMLFGGIPSELDSFDGLVANTEDISIEIGENGTSSKKRKKKNSSSDHFDDEIISDVVDGVSELDGTSGAEVGNDEATVDTPSHKRCRRRKKSKQKEDDVTDNSVNGDSTQDLQGASQGSPTKSTSAADAVKYIPPHLRSHAGNESEDHAQIRRRVRGLLNRLSESNVESITGEMATIFYSVTRSLASQVITDEVLAACSSGPRGNEQYATVFAAFVAGMACSVGMDFSARLMASLAKCFEDEYHKEDNLSLRNLTLLLSHLCIFGVCSSDLIYDFLIILSKRLTEIDVSTILTILQCCGMKIRGDDPTAMKDFIQSVQNRVYELKASSDDGQSDINGKRMEFMLETICDIKNNKKRPKEETAPHTRIKKWLQKLRVEDILIRGLKWSKLLDPHKKGQWWLSGDVVATNENVKDIANRIDKEAQEAQKMLDLAASQRMNTDNRRAIFCVIMSGEDYVDTFVKLLRLKLTGKQDREIMRVLLECCLGEKVFNKYYTLLASKLCEHDRNHKKTLQFCIWDQYKQLESLQLSRSMNLAKFVAEMAVSFTLSLGVLKTEEFTDAGQLSPKKIIHFRMLFDAIFEHHDKLIWNMFTRLAVNPELELLRHALELFIKEYVLKSNAALTNKFKIVRKALNNTQGVLI